MQARRYFERSSARVAQSNERLSSGLRINRAVDDAAGLSIATDLHVTERLYGQAVRNLNDGLSHLQIAADATQELHSTLIRLEELAQQAANGTLSHAQRKALDEEAQALSKEYLRILSTTEFNNEKVFRPDAVLSLQGSFDNGNPLDVAIGQHLTVHVGTGTFESPVTVDSLPGIQSVTLADLNNDGFLDMITAQEGTGNQIGVRLGLGNGEFGAETAIATGSNKPSSVALADFNNDGILDILVENGSGSSSVRVAMGTGTGGFGAFTSYSSGGRQPESIVTGDFDGDGNQDFAVAAEGPVVVFWGDGTGSFTGPHTLANPGGGAGVKSYESLLAVDLNNDGLLDLVTARDSSANINVTSFISRGDGTFERNHHNMAAFSVGPLAAGDLDGDGIVDLMVGNDANHAVFMKGRGDGTFTVAATHAVGGSHVMRLTDLNNDGNLDYLGVNRTGNSLYVAFGDGKGNFGDSTVITDSLNTPRGMALGDIDQDGVLDLLVPTEAIPPSASSEARPKQGYPCLSFHCKRQSKR